MTKTALRELRLYQHIDTVIKRELRRPEWSVVEAVLLICGIAPPPDCEAVPEVAARLLNETESATDNQLAVARLVLDLWLKQNPTEGPGASYGDWRVVFIRWARDKVGGADGPELLEHFHQQMARRPKELPPLALSAGALERFEQLEELAQPRGKRHGQSRRSGRPSRMTDWFRVAWDDLGERAVRNADTVMAKLAEMLDARDCPPLVCVESDGIAYAERDRTGRVIRSGLYPYDNLKRWVNRQHERVRMGIESPPNP